MKILLINKYHFLKGGAERAFFDMARILAVHGHEVAFFSMQDPKNASTPWERFFVESVDYAASRLSVAEKLRMAMRIIWNREANQKLESLLREFQPDIVHLHNIYHQLSPSILWVLKRHRIPMVMTLHDYKLLSPNYSLFVRGQIWDHTSGWRCIKDRCVKDSLPKSLVCALEQWFHRLIGSYGLIRTFISPSLFLAEKFRVQGFQGRIEHIPNSLSSEAFPILSIGPEKKSQNFLFFGRLSPEKGADVLIRAFVVLPDHQTLDIVGDGPDRIRLETLVTTLGLGARIHVLGAQFGAALDDLKRTAYGILIPSSWYENFPYVVTESLQSGCVVIAARIGGIPERIVHGRNGFLFEPGDTENLVSVIRSLPQYDLALLRKNAQESVGDLSEAIFYERLIALYRTLISRV